METDPDYIKVLLKLDWPAIAKVVLERGKKKRKGK